MISFLYGYYPGLLRAALLAAGVAQLVIVCASFAIPKVLDWKAELEPVGNLTRQIFWTYAGYILISNLAFGLLSAFAGGALLDGSILASAVTGFIALWWGARLAIQFFYFDTTQMPGGRFHKLAEAALILAFVFLAVVYAAALSFNLGH
ncbi:MAG: hypothetical protein KDN22_05175 [Verrucomicrobiae bacterium]|nr:hypothetical protein [Verrucomicrobiae bacterium]